MVRQAHISVFGWSVSILELRCAESTLLGFDIDLRHAERADLGGGLCLFLRLFYQCMGAVEGLDDTEDDQRDDQEVDHILNETADHQIGTAYGDGHLAEVDAAADHADDRSDHIVHQAGNDGAEGTAHNNTDSHIHDIAAGDEFFEFRYETHMVYPFLY